MTLNLHKVPKEVQLKAMDETCPLNTSSSGSDRGSLCVNKEHAKAIDRNEEQSLL